LAFSYPNNVTLNLIVLCTPSAPGSILPQNAGRAARWMLNQVQHDDAGTHSKNLKGIAAMQSRATLWRVNLFKAKKTT
jgi:hypothetical protein